MLKSNPKTAHLPVIFIGANGIELCKEYLLKSGAAADAYIQKPIVDDQQFADTIRDLLKQ